MNASLTITTCEIFDDFAHMTPIYGQGCNYVTRYGVNGFQVNHDVLIDNGIEQKAFHLVTQSLDRSDNIQGYNGVEMAFANGYGVDDDESGKAFDFLQQNEAISFDEAMLLLETVIEGDANLCRNWYNNHLADLISPMYAQADDEQQDDLSLAPKIIADFKGYDNLALFDEREVKELMGELCQRYLKDEYVGDDNYSFSVSDNPNGYENLVDTAMALVEEAYNDMGERGLSDDELLERITDTDLVFVNIFDRATTATDGVNAPYVATDTQVYMAFYGQLHELLFGTRPSINVAHIEQNELQGYARKSVKYLCYVQVDNLINDYIEKLKKKPM